MFLCFTFVVMFIILLGLLGSLSLLGIVELLNAVAGAVLGFRTSCVGLHLLLWSLTRNWEEF